jgi:hypothetical protein
VDVYLISAYVFIEWCLMKQGDSFTYWTWGTVDVRGGSMKTVGDFMKMRFLVCSEP